LWLILTILLGEGVGEEETDGTVTDDKNGEGRLACGHFGFIGMVGV
jgi:hypothetical protein